MAGKAKDDFNAKHGVLNTTVDHLVSDSLIQSVMYPAHPPRKESGIYRKTHQLLIYKEDMPCWICGVKESNIKADGKGEVTASNPLGAKQLETHHNIIEWAAANAIDWDKVIQDYPGMKSLSHVAHAWDLENGTGHRKYGKIKHTGMSKDHDGVPKYKEIDATEFLDGVEQMKVLCAIGTTEVLMADGTNKKISDVEAGDCVIGGDGRPHEVIAKRVLENDTRKLYQINGKLTVTEDHPIFTQRGWVRADELLLTDELYKITDKHISPLGRDKILVGVVNDRISGKLHSNVPLFVSSNSFAMPNESVDLNDEFKFRDIGIYTASGNIGLFFVGDPEPVKSVVQVRFNRSGSMSYVSTFSIFGISPHTFARTIASNKFSRFVGRIVNRIATSKTFSHCFTSFARVKSINSTLVRTINSWSVFQRFKTFIADRTVNVNSRRPIFATSDRIASFGTGSNNSNSTSPKMKFRIATNTFSNLQFFFGNVCRNTMMTFHKIKASSATYANPLLYDLSIKDSHSFVADGITVHNCDVHHRNPYYGIHAITGPIWQLQRYSVKGFEFVPKDLKDGAKKKGRKAVGRPPG